MIKIYSKKSLVAILVFALVVSGLMNAGGYYLIKWLSFNMVLDTAKSSPLLINGYGWVSENLYTVVIPSITGFFLFAGLLLWIGLKSIASGVMQQSRSEVKETGVKEKGKKDFIDQKIEQDRKRRLFLHSLSVLQREGRLLDFFAEDLSLYEDEQIGAAVRSIQEDCKRAVKKYIDPKPVIEQEEGESIAIEPGFDIDSITLVGNVTGNPPFKGILKHRGWKAGKNEIPRLSDIQDASVIIPAEVEIQ